MTVKNLVLQLQHDNSTAVTPEYKFISALMTAKELQAEVIHRERTQRSIQAIKRMRIDNQ